MKVNGVALVMVIIFVFLIGMGVGYTLTIRVQENQRIEEANRSETEVAQTANNSDTDDNNIDYSQIIMPKESEIESQEVKINGTTYKITYSPIKLKTNTPNVYNTSVKVSLNDKEVGVLRLGLLDYSKIENGANPFKLELTVFCKNYILIFVNAHQEIVDNIEIDENAICIINTQGEVIHKFELSGHEYVSEKTKGTLSFDITNDSLILYHYDAKTTNILKLKYTMEDGKLVKNVISSFGKVDYEALGLK